MKTRDRILYTSLVLFNDEGEQNVTTVDIANEMDISPGNLYYHFKGKESIIEELYSNFDHQLSTLLHQSRDEELTVEQHWYFIYVIFEEIYKFRFFYLNAANIMLRYPDIERRFRRLIALKVQIIEDLCTNLIGKESIIAQSLDVKLLAENIGLSLLYWFSYQNLLHPELESGDVIHKGVYHVLNLVAPYAGEYQTEFLAAIQTLYHENVF